MSARIFNINKGVQGYYIENNRFNTTLLTYNFYIPLNKEDMAINSLMPYILTSCSEKYRDYIALNRQLLQLYGADLSCSVSKCGDCMHIKMGISVINNEFSLDDRKPVTDANELLGELIFAPAISENGFYDDDVEREKLKTVERIEGEINNKRSFARTRLFEEMFASQPYGKFIYGRVEEVNAITGAQLLAAWKKLLETAFVRIILVGNCSPDEVFGSAEKYFSKINREKVTTASDITVLLEAQEVNRVTDYMEITQGKLAMGFTSQLHGDIKTASALSLFADIFGGGPYSKLFANVREKQSLCYYCSAAARRSKGFVMVESGVEKENAQKTVDAVLKELKEMQKGNFDESVISAAKKSVSDALSAYNDHASAIDGWYSRDLFSDVTPEEAIEILNAVTKEEIIKAAKGVKLHTVYMLLPKEDK